MMLLPLVMMPILSALLMCSCITLSIPPGGTQTEQSTEAPQNTDGGGTEAGAPADSSSDPEGGAASEAVISEDEVIAIVLERVPGATADEITYLGLGRDDGMAEYEGKLIHNGLEYEFEIDASNGNILEWEIDD